MTTVASLVSQNISNQLANEQTWGLFYNAKSYNCVGDGVTDDYTNLYKLINTIINGVQATIALSGTFRIGSNLTIPSNIDLFFSNGSSLSPDSGKTITINGTIQASLNQIFKGLGAISLTDTMVNVYPQWFGAKGDGAADDTQAIKNAISASSGIFTIPPGTYNFSDAITFPDNSVINSSLATKFNYTGTRVANRAVLQFGNNVTCGGFNLYNQFSTFDTNNPMTGVLLHNVSYTTIKDFEISGFEVGLSLLGDSGKGCVYNNFFPRLITTNLTGIKLYSTDTGWANDNNFFGGHITFNSGRYTSTSIGISQDSAGSNSINGNKLYGTSIEGVGTGVFCGGFYNMFLGMRIELNGGNNTFVFTDTGQSAGGYIASNNFIFGQYGNAPLITQNANAENTIINYGDKAYFRLLAPNEIDFSVNANILVGSQRIIMPFVNHQYWLAMVGGFGGGNAGFFYDNTDATYGEGLYWLTGGTKRLKFGTTLTVINAPTSGTDATNKSYVDTKATVWESGATAARPSSPSVGQRFYDTTLGKPIWYNGSSVWHDATGASA